MQYAILCHRTKFQDGIYFFVIGFLPKKHEQKMLIIYYFAVACFAEKQFLKFFFSQLETNATGRYTDEFPYVSLCGRERNFIRCDDLPVVFTELVCHSADDSSNTYHLTYAGGTMSVAFQPDQVVMLPETGRVYHIGPANGGGAGLIKSSLAIELSKYFEFADGGFVPTHFIWQGQKHELTKSIVSRLTQIKRSHSPAVCDQ